MKRKGMLGALPLLCAVAVAQTGTQPAQQARPAPAATGVTQSNQQQTGGVTGSAMPAPPAQSTGKAGDTAVGSNAGTTSANPPGVTTETPAPEAPPPSDAELQNQIQTALGKEPTLSHDSVTVAVSADALELSGTVASRKEKITATRIAQSFAPGKKLSDRMRIVPPAENSQSPNQPAVSEKPQSVEGRHTGASEPLNEKQAAAPRPPK